MTNVPANVLTIPVGKRDHVAGALDAPTILVEYGDFECPYCGAAYPVVEAVRRQLGDALCFVFRHFPLTDSHPHAESAAEAAEAAAAQGKFWEMHHLLYEHQRTLDPSDLARFAEELQLDVARFSRELSAGTYASRVQEDFQSGIRSGVNGTPTFFVNGVRFDGPWNDVAAFTDALSRPASVRPTG